MKGRSMPMFTWLLIMVIALSFMLTNIVGWFKLTQSIDTNIKLRTASWVAHKLTGSLDCLADSSAKSKNVLSKTKIESAVSNYATANNHKCAQVFCYAYSVEIYDFKNDVSYKFGSLEPKGILGKKDESPEIFLIPVSIVDGETAFPAIMQVTVGYMDDRSCHEVSFYDSQLILGTKKACEYVDEATLASGGGYYAACTGGN